MRAPRLEQPVLHAALVFAPATVALESDRARHNVVQKSAVMADEEDCPVVVLQKVLEQFQGVDIEVVSRLVQHQNIRRTSEQSRQQQAISLASGQRPDR